MLNLAIFRKTLRDSSVLIVVSSIGIIAFVVLFVWAMLNMGDDLMEFLSRFAFLRRMMEVAFSIRVSGEMSVNTLFAVCFAHAMVMILSWSVVIATSSRTTVGEIERGTADLLLTLPVSRACVYVSSSLVWILATGLLAFCPVIGVWIGTSIFEIDEPVDISRYIAPAFNLMALLLAVGGVSSMVSCLFSRRGPAIATIVGMGLSSMVLNLLEPFIEQIQHIRFLGLLNYMRPVDIVRTGEWPVTHIAILASLGLICWAIGLVLFCRKDIQTA